MANLVQYKRMLMFYLEDWGAGPSVFSPLTTPLTGDLIGMADGNVSVDANECG